MGYFALLISVFALLVLFTADNITPCANAQSTICNVADSHVFSSGVIINEDSGATANDDFRIEGGTEVNLLDTDASGDQIAIGQDASSNVVDFEVGVAAHFKAATEIDNVNIDETSNGLTYAIEKLKPYDISGHITFLKGCRSKVATNSSKVQ